MITRKCNRTQEEIVAEIKRLQASPGEDFFGFRASDLVEYLEFENAKPFLKDGVTEQDWIDAVGHLTPEMAIEDYMPFAWDKANNCRGLSANRSLMHMQAWLWLMNTEESNKLVETMFDNYRFYGKEKLVEICKFLEIDCSEWDDGIRVN